jgi:ATP-dependent DNA ligase
MKFNSADEKDTKKLVWDDNWVFEQKMDGTRGLAVVGHNPVAPSRVWWPGRGGRGALAHTAATQHLPAINPVLQRVLGSTPGLIVFDGEIMNTPDDPSTHGQFHVFDVPYMRFGGVEVVRSEDSWERRHVALDAPDLHDLFSNTPVKIVRTARGQADKRALLNAVRDNGGEGVMAKNVHGRYLPGARSDAALKLKFVKTADVIVTSVNRPDARHGSCTFGVYGPPHQASDSWWVIATTPAGEKLFLIPVGSTSLIGKPEVQVGDVIEVAYLYRTDSGQLYQPRMMRVRTDKASVDCDVSQFRAYSRRVV